MRWRIQERIPQPHRCEATANSAASCFQSPAVLSFTDASSQAEQKSTYGQCRSSAGIHSRHMFFCWHTHSNYICEIFLIYTLTFFRPAQRARIIFCYNGKRTRGKEYRTVIEIIRFASGKRPQWIRQRLSATLALSSTLHPVLDFYIAVLIQRRRRTSLLFILWDLRRELVLLVLREWCRFAPFVIKLSRKSSKCSAEKIMRRSQPGRVQIFANKVSWRILMPMNAHTSWLLFRA